jgi:hypothetical protein
MFIMSHLFGGGIGSVLVDNLVFAFLLCANEGRI